MSSTPNSRAAEPAELAFSRPADDALVVRLAGALTAWDSGLLNLSPPGARRQR